MEKLNTAAHTPTPWTSVLDEDERIVIVGREGEDLIADCHMLNGLSKNQCEANAALIVKAVNVHEEFVDKVKAVSNSLSICIGAFPKKLRPGIREVIYELDNAIYHAEGKV